MSETLEQPLPAIHKCNVCDHMSRWTESWAWTPVKISIETELQFNTCSDVCRKKCEDEGLIEKFKNEYAAQSEKDPAKETIPKAETFEMQCPVCGMKHLHPKIQLGGSLAFVCVGDHYDNQPRGCGAQITITTQKY